MSTKRRKRHTSEQIVKKLRDADAMPNAGNNSTTAASGQRRTPTATSVASDSAAHSGRPSTFFCSPLPRRHAA